MAGIFVRGKPKENLNHVHACSCTNLSRCSFGQQTRCRDGQLEDYYSIKAASCCFENIFLTESCFYLPIGATLLHKPEANAVRGEGHSCHICIHLNNSTVVDCLANVTLDVLEQLASCHNRVGGVSIAV
jgi:hypothetical protein